LKQSTKTAKATHGKAPSPARVGAYAKSAGSYGEYKGEGPNVQRWPSDYGKPHRTGNMKKSSGKKGY